MNVVKVVQAEGDGEEYQGTFEGVNEGEMDEEFVDVLFR